MPFAGYDDFDACVAANGDKGDPKAYCASIMREVEGKSEQGHSFAELPDEVKKAWLTTFTEEFSKNGAEAAAKVAWAGVYRTWERSASGQWIPLKAFDDIKFKSIQKSDRVIFGAANVAIRDSQGDMFTPDALRQALRTYMDRGEILFYHRNIPIGRMLPSYTATDGQKYETKVEGDALNLVARIYKDIDVANAVWKDVEEGRLRAFSIAGQVIGDPVRICNGGDCFNRIDHFDLHEVSIVPEPANAASYFTIIKSVITTPVIPAIVEKVKHTCSWRKKAAALEVLITDEKTKVLNCPRFTEKALGILKEHDEGCPEGQRYNDEDECVPIADPEKAAVECPEGNHMVDGECVPEKEKAEAPPSNPAIGSDALQKIVAKALLTSLLMEKRE